MEKELWLDVNGYEGIYEVSNQGTVRRVDNKKILSQRKGTKGYLRVALSKGGVRKELRTSRVVAKAFIDNPLKKEQVNHKNGIKNDNRVENLEWCTNRENVLHAYRVLGVKSVIGKLRYWKGKFGKYHHSSVKVVQLSLDGKEIKIWDALAQTENAGFHRGHVWSCCVGKSATHLGYKWKYYNN
jgi:hypothetical protein